MKKRIYSFLGVIFLLGLIIFPISENVSASNGKEVFGFTNMDINIRDKAKGNLLGVMPAGSFIVGVLKDDWIEMPDGRYIYNFGLREKNNVSGYLTRETNYRDINGNLLGQKYPLTKIEGIKKDNWIYFRENGRINKIWDFGLIYGSYNSGYLHHTTNIRDLSHNIVDEYKKNTYVEGIQEGDWIYFKEGNRLLKVYNFGLSKTKQKSISGYIGRDVNVRNSIGGDLLGYIEVGTYINGIEYDDWLEIDYNSKKAYIYNFGVYKNKTVGYTDRIMNLRNSDSSNSSIIGQLPQNYYVNGYSNGDYTIFYYNNKYVYVYNKWLNKTSNASNETSSDSKIEKFVLVLDPGHGPGIGSNRGGLLFNEGDQNYEFSQHLMREGKKYKNLIIKNTRPTGNEDPSFKERVAISKGADLFLSLHTNAAKNTVRGVEIFGSNQNTNLTFGKDITEAWSRILNTPNRGVKYDQVRGSFTRTPKKNAIDAFFVFKNNTAKQKFLIESVFHTNLEDSTAFLNNQERLAKEFFKILSKHYNID